MSELSRRRGIIYLNEYEIKELLGLDRDMQVISVFADSRTYGIGIMVSGNDLPITDAGNEPVRLSGAVVKSGHWARAT